MQPQYASALFLSCASEYITTPGTPVRGPEFSVTYNVEGDRSPVINLEQRARHYCAFLNQSAVWTFGNRPSEHFRLRVFFFVFFLSPCRRWSCLALLGDYANLC